jgi:DNA-binding CsgD family transcriptional regulator
VYFATIGQIAQYGQIAGGKGEVFCGVVELTARERAILRLWIAGRDTKHIGHALELSVTAVNHQLQGTAVKMGVSRSQIKTWMMQHPQCLDRGAVSEPGLHPEDCHCSALYCVTMRTTPAGHPLGCRCTSCPTARPKAA